MRNYDKLTCEHIHTICEISDWSEGDVIQHIASRKLIVYNGLREVVASMDKDVIYEIIDAYCTQQKVHGLGCETMVDFIDGCLMDDGIFKIDKNLFIKIVENN